MADHIPYQITSQNLREELTPDGRFIDTWTVNYSTPSGTHGYVKVPAELYTPAYVDAAIAANVQQIEGVHTLGAEPHPDNVPG